jgi:4'-phosphopantetheinyl transferase
MTDAPGTMDVWSMRIEGLPLPGRSAPLSDEELRRASSLLLPDVRRRFVLARTALRVVLAGYLGVGAADLEFRYGRYGKPALAGRHRDALHFNLSHAGDALLIAVSEGCQVGADVERIRPWPARSPDAPVHYLPDVERDALDNVPNPDWPRAFTAAWVRMEAVAKGVGTGLSTRIRGWMTEATEGAVTHSVTDDTGDTWLVAEVEADPGHVAAVACRETLPQLHRRHIDLTAVVDPGASVGLTGRTVTGCPASSSDSVHDPRAEVQDHDFGLRQRGHRRAQPLVTAHHVRPQGLSAGLCQTRTMRRASPARGHE